MFFQKKGTGGGLETRRTLSQTSAIIRYCADLAGLTPIDPFLAAKVDQVIQTCTDFHEIWNIAVNNGRTAHKKENTKQVQIIVTQLRFDGAKHMKFFEKLIKDNMDSEWFIVSNKMTVADIALWKMIGTLSGDHATSSPVLFWPRELLEEWPLLQNLIDRINAHPLIHNYVLSLFPHGKGESPYPGRMANPRDGQWPGMGFSLECPDQKWVKWWRDEQGIFDPSELEEE